MEGSMCTRTEVQVLPARRRHAVVAQYELSALNTTGGREGGRETAKKGEVEGESVYAYGYRDRHVTWQRFLGTSSTREAEPYPPVSGNISMSDLQGGADERERKGEVERRRERGRGRGSEVSQAG